MKKHLLSALICAASAISVFAQEGATYSPYQSETMNESLVMTGDNTRWTGNIILSNTMSTETKTISPLQTAANTDQASNRQIFFDKSSEIYTVYAGATVNIDNNQGTGDGATQKYLFVDWNRDGRFGPETITGADQFVDAATKTVIADSEMVDFTSLRINENWVHNSIKNLSTQHHPYNQQMKIAVPENTTPGQYRVRYKYEWNGWNPNAFGANLTSGIVVDFTIEVVPAPEPIEAPAVGSYIRLKNSLDYPFAIAGESSKFPETVTDNGSDIVFYTADRHLASYKYGVVAKGQNLADATTAEENNNLADVPTITFGVCGLDKVCVRLDNASTRPTEQGAHRFFFSGGNGTDGGNGDEVPDGAGYRFTYEYVAELPVAIHNDGFGSIVAPVAVKTPAIDVATLYASAINAEGVLSFMKYEEEGEIIPANTHVIVKATPGTSVNIPVATGVEVSPAVGHEKLVGHHLTKTISAADGVNYYAKTVMPEVADDAENNNVVAADNVLFNKLDITNGKVTVPAGAMVFTTETSTEPTLEVNLATGHATTGIREISAGGSVAENVVYDLQGRRVNGVSKGIFIVNGKKMLVK